MTLVKWRSTRDFHNIRNEFDRMLGESFCEPGSEDNYSDRFCSPRVNLSETEDALMIPAELPGVGKEHVKVSLQDNVLFLKGDKQIENEEKGENILRTERIFGAFKRSITLPVSVDANKIKARIKDGVLAITLQKSEEARIKEIPISVN